MYVNDAPVALVTSGGFIITSGGLVDWWTEWLVAIVAIPLH